MLDSLRIMPGLIFLYLDQFKLNGFGGCVACAIDEMCYARPPVLLNVLKEPISNTTFANRPTNVVGENTTILRKRAAVVHPDGRIIPIAYYHFVVGVSLRKTVKHISSIAGLSSLSRGM